MPNIGKLLKEETARISRREARAAAAKNLKGLSALKRELAALGKRIAGLEKRVPAPVAPVAPVAPAAAGEGGKEARAVFTPRGIRSLRKKLGLSQAKFAELTGVSAQAVFTWERGGPRKKLSLRRATAEALARVRGLGRRDLRKQLAGPEAGDGSETGAPAAGGQRPAKRAAKRAAKRPAKRAAKRPAKRAAKRPAKRAAKRPAKRTAKRPAKRAARRPVKIEAPAQETGETNAS